MCVAIRWLTSRRLRRARMSPSIGCSHEPAAGAAPSPRRAHPPSRRAGFSTDPGSRLGGAPWPTCAHFLPVRRARRVLNALLGFAVSPWWVAGLRAQAARLLETRFLPHVRALIMAAPVAHADETTARAEGALSYLHVACTRFLTAMHVGDRSKDTIDAAGIWPTFTGVLVRDGYAGYEHLVDRLAR